MNTNPLICRGLDGSDPLTMLASLGLLTIGDRAGIVERLAWRWVGAWRPVFHVAASEDKLISAVVEAIVGTEAAAARSQLEQLEQEFQSEALRVAELEETIRRAADLNEIREAKRVKNEALAANKVRKARIKTSEAEVQALAAHGVLARHPITALAQHLDDVATGGLSRSNFLELVQGHSGMPYMSGLACDANLDVKKKTIIARTHLSFANGGSGKMLLKDFAGVARLVTAERVQDALLGSARRRDGITGLGWDPESQRSYALQFSDPQDEVTCVVVHHALAFFGLSCFTVLPTMKDRVTVGVWALPSGRTNVEPDDDEEGEPPARGRVTEQLTWPLWESPLGLDAVRALIGWRELAQPQPSPEACRAVGLAAVMRSRRFSLNKRSYLSPAQPVF